MGAVLPSPFSLGQRARHAVIFLVSSVTLVAESISACDACALVSSVTPIFYQKVHCAQGRCISKCAPTLEAAQTDVFRTAARLLKESLAFTLYSSLRHLGDATRAENHIYFRRRMMRCRMLVPSAHCKDVLASSTKFAEI